MSERGGAASRFVVEKPDRAGRTLSPTLRESEAEHDRYRFFQKLTNFRAVGDRVGAYGESPEGKSGNR